MKNKKKVNGKGEVSMSLYDINKNIIGQLPIYTEEQIKELQDKINVFRDNFEDNYFMLLCNDIHYYTVFYYEEYISNEFHTLGDAVIQLLLERNYTIHSEEITEDHIEIWIKDEEENTYVFMLFPYSQGVVLFG